MRSLVAAVAVLFAAAACDDPTMLRPDSGPDPEVDLDGDGVNGYPGLDCNDNNASIYPGAPDPCDGIDQNCDGKVDEAYDYDLDGVTVCQGDCADNDASVYPGHVEEVDGKDNDCDLRIDNHTVQYDDDGDGWADDQGDCDDEQEFVNPGAVEVQLNQDGEPEGVDNDCDGLIDEAAEPCDGEMLQDDPWAYAKAIELCEGVTDASFVGPTDPTAREIRLAYGSTYIPKSGLSMIGLSSGIVADEDDGDYVAPQSGTQFDNSYPHPNPSATPVGCSEGPDPTEVNDYAELRLELEVPTNAQSFSFDFNFMTVEYPEWVCSSFDDTFVAYLESEGFTGNISFDAMGNPISVNVSFFTVCDGGVGCTGGAELAGTGHQLDGGGTGWLTTTAPVTPGEKITLRFIIFDEGDWILDSAVLIDNFRWKLEAIDEPVTEG